MAVLSVWVWGGACARCAAAERLSVRRRRLHIRWAMLGYGRGAQQGRRVGDCLRSGEGYGSVAVYVCVRGGPGPVWSRACASRGLCVGVGVGAAAPMSAPGVSHAPNRACDSSALRRRAVRVRHPVSSVGRSLLLASPRFSRRPRPAPRGVHLRCVRARAPQGACGASPTEVSRGRCAIRHDSRRMRAQDSRGRLRDMKRRVQSIAAQLE